MKYLLLLIPLILFSTSYSQKKRSKAVVKKNFITSLKNYKGNDTLFKSNLNHLFKLTFISDSEVISEAPAITCTSNNFSGVSRRLSKTSIASALLKSMTFTSFIASLPSDKSMMANHNITTAPNNPRVPQENNNIQLNGIFLFAIKRENDNDYHIIIGDKNKKFFNVEISGLPPHSAASFITLSKTRTAVETYFGKPNCNVGGYNVFPQGIKIQISGSTFYDIDHAPGTIGPQGYMPATAWEIHPVTDIKFLK